MIGCRLAVVWLVALLAAPLVAEAQQAGRVYGVGFVSLGSLSRSGTWHNFLEAMRKLNYVEGIRTSGPGTGAEEAGLRALVREGGIPETVDEVRRDWPPKERER